MPEGSRRANKQNEMQVTQSMLRDEFELFKAAVMEEIQQTISATIKDELQVLKNKIINQEK